MSLYQQSLARKHDLIASSRLAAGRTSTFVGAASLLNTLSFDWTKERKAAGLCSPDPCHQQSPTALQPTSSRILIALTLVCIPLCALPLLNRQLLQS